MENKRKCPRCGTEVPANLPEDQCPKCMLEIGIGTQSFEASGAQTARDTSPPPSPAELAGHFPQLEILELAGQGGMGAVYKARHLRLDRLVALKILSINPARDPVFAERFTQEARTLARLSHPHIVGIYDFGEVDGLFYLLMEYVDGLSLRQLERAGGVTPAEAIKIIPPICDALQYAHDQGIVHRDIKPENILIDQAGRVKIADFGLAKLLRRPSADLPLTQTDQVMGTPHYMAPEQMERPLEVDHRADLYSLGVVFYEMLTGELPVGRFAAPSKKVEVNVRFDHVVLRALEKERELRYQQASEIKTDLQDAGQTAPPVIQARNDPGRNPEDLRAQHQNSPDRSRRWFFLTATAFLIAIGLIFALVVGGLLLAISLPALMRGKEYVKTVKAPSIERAVTVRSFTTNDPTISRNLTITNDTWSLHAVTNQTVRLFEVPNPEIGPGILSYQADLQTEGAAVRVYLEMWCRFPDGREFFSRGLEHALMGTTDWTTTQTPFLLEEGQVPDLVRLNVVIERTGEVRIRNVALRYAPR